ncbi:uncharacterized protein [Diadema antillarum]|uniref:uncharacterized protein n=1 Tax=Diadema antillarum TaxID=105358 RepID=UPI003A8810BB
MIIRVSAVTFLVASCLVLFSASSGNAQCTESGLSTNISHSFLKEGESVTLSCYVAQAGGQLISWLNPTGVILSVGPSIWENAGERFSISADNSQPSCAVYNLTITNVTVNDAGTYTCRPTVGTTPSSTEVVYFGYAPGPTYPECVVTGGSTLVMAGDLLEFFCETEVGNPEWDLSWESSFYSLKTSPMTTEATVENIKRIETSMNATTDQTGTMMTCFARCTDPECLDSKTRNCTLGPIIVVDQPVNTFFTVSDTALYVEAGGNATVSCNTTLPGAEVKWFLHETVKDNFHLTTGPKGNETTLFVTSITNDTIANPFICSLTVDGRIISTIPVTVTFGPQQLVSTVFATTPLPTTTELSTGNVSANPFVNATAYPPLNTTGLPENATTASVVNASAMALVNTTALPNATALPNTTATAYPPVNTTGLPENATTASVVNASALALVNTTALPNATALPNTTALPTTTMNITTVALNFTNTLNTTLQGNTTTQQPTANATQGSISTALPTTMVVTTNQLNMSTTSSAPMLQTNTSQNATEMPMGPSMEPSTPVVTLEPQANMTTAAFQNTTENSTTSNSTFQPPPSTTMGWWQPRTPNIPQQTMYPQQPSGFPVQPSDSPRQPATNVPTDPAATQNAPGGLSAFFTMPTIIGIAGVGGVLLIIVIVVVACVLSSRKRGGEHDVEELTELSKRNSKPIRLDPFEVPQNANTENDPTFAGFGKGTSTQDLINISDDPTGGNQQNGSNNKGGKSRGNGESKPLTANDLLSNGMSDSAL